MQIIKATDRDVITYSLKVLRQGGVVAYPTETAYGLGGDWTKLSVHERIRKIKGRPEDKPFPVIVSSMAMAERYVKFNVKALQLARKYWPGPLSLVLPLRGRIYAFPTGEAIGRGRRSATRTLSLRISPHPIALRLVRGLGKPLIATSANVSGAKTLYGGREVVAEFMGRQHQPDLVIEAGRLVRRRPSTVVRVWEDGEIEVLREGHIRINPKSKSQNPK